LKIKLLEEFLINFTGINLIDWEGHFKTFVHAKLEFPAFLNQCLFLFFDLPLVLNNLGSLCDLIKGIIVSTIEEKNASFL
jgi:hypothetical protein